MNKLTKELIALGVFVFISAVLVAQLNVKLPIQILAETILLLALIKALEYVRIEEITEASTYVAMILSTITLMISPFLI